MSLQVQSESNSVKPRSKMPIEGLLMKREGDLRTFLPAGMDVNRFRMICLRSIASEPKLQRCSLASLYKAITHAAEMGLEPDGRLGHLVPFGNDAQFVADYKGLIWALRKYAGIKRVMANAVYENDEFDYAFGLEQKLHHKPTLGERGALTHFWCTITDADGEVQFDVMTKGEVDAIMEASPTRGKSGPWKNHYAEMGKKTVIKRTVKKTPIRIETQLEDSLDRQGVVLEGMAEAAATEREAKPLSSLERFEEDFADPIPPAEEDVPQEAPELAQAADVVDPDTGEVIEPEVLDDTLEPEPRPLDIPSIYEAMEGMSTTRQLQKYKQGLTSALAAASKADQKAFNEMYQERLAALGGGQ